MSQSDDVITFHDYPHNIMFFTGGVNEPVITIHEDGRIELGRGVLPDDAAKAFWEAIERLNPYHDQMKAAR